MIEITIPRQMGLHVRKARTKQGLTQRELAQRAGVSERLVLSLELGEAPGIRLDKLMSITDALGMHIYVSLPSSAATDAPDVQIPTSHEVVSSRHQKTASTDSYQDLYNQLVEATREGSRP